MSDAIHRLAAARTAERAEWIADVFRAHEAFRGGEIEVEALDDVPHAGRYWVVYRGPRRTTGWTMGVEPLNVDDEDGETEFFADRTDAERACTEARWHIAPSELSAVHVDRDTDSGLWYLTWIYATVRHSGEPQPETPQRPGS
jgi:hypothetical protein